MLIVLCLNIYMANYLRIDIGCLWAQSTEHKLNNTSNSKPDWNEAVRGDNKHFNPLKQHSI